MVKFDEWHHLYELIPRGMKKEFVTSIGFKTCHSFIRQYFVSEKNFNELRNFVNNLGLISQNTVLNYVTFDGKQVSKHYLALTKLISSSEFQILTPGDKIKLQDYHGKLFKQLN